MLQIILGEYNLQSLNCEIKTNVTLDKTLANFTVIYWSSSILHHSKKFVHAHTYIWLAFAMFFFISFGLHYYYLLLILNSCPVDLCNCGYDFVTTSS